MSARIAIAAEVVGRHAVAALREELETHPKPGLVSPGDPGAHGDMDAGTFEASVRALRGYFPAVARAAAEGANLGALRALGVRAEQAMLRATDGVNTHRGAIFLLGAVAAAAGRLAARGEVSSAPAVREELRLVFCGAILRDLPRPRDTHGALVERRHGAGGARGEAAAGFPHLFEVTLPALEDALRRGAPRRAAAVQALLACVAVLPDTNLLWRGGPAGLAFARAGARAFLGAGGVHRAGWELRARALHEALVARRLSPGGSADLLAGALFLHRLSSVAAEVRAA